MQYNGKLTNNQLFKSAVALSLNIIHIYAVVVCLSVCVSLSHSGIVSKRLNVGSRK